MRIAELLNGIGEIDADDTASALALGRSVSAPARSSSGDQDDDRDVDMDDDDEHSASCPEDKKRPRDFGSASSSASSSAASLSTRPPTRKRSKSSMTRSASSLASPTPPFMAISSLLHHPTEDDGDEAEHSVSSPAAAGGDHGKKRSTRALFPAASDADRRAKQRLIVKRCYYKKINTIKSLRDEVDALDESFRAALRSRQAQDAAAAAAGALSHEDLRLRALYVEALDVKDALRKENRRLRRLADEYYMKNQGRLRQLLDSNHKVRKCTCPR